MPLAPISDVEDAGVVAVLERMRQRVNAEVPEAERGDFWTRVEIVLGLRYNEDEVNDLMHGVKDIMEASSTYRAIRRSGREEGRVEEAQSLLLELGEERFNTAPDDVTRTAILNIADLARLRRLCRRVLQATSWANLLAEPEPEPEATP